MYEFGDYGTRVQDPLDPNYEYRPGGRPVIRCTEAAQSKTCTYNQMEQYYVSFYKYKMCKYNCQDFVRGLINYINRGCRIVDLPNVRKRQEVSDLEFARYVYNLAGVNCPISAELAIVDPPNDVTQQTTTNSASQTNISITLTIAVIAMASLFL